VIAVGNKKCFTHKGKRIKKEKVIVVICNNIILKIPGLKSKGWYAAEPPAQSESMTA